MIDFIHILEKSNNNLPLSIEYRNQSNNFRFFLDMLAFFEEKMNTSEFKSIENKIINALQSNNFEKYSQTMSELIVLYHIYRYYDHSVNYEPRYNGNYNPECSFSYGKYTINVEVKCPDYAKRINVENRNTLKIDLIGQRLPDKQILEDIISTVKPNIINTPYDDIEAKELMDLKLKDFLVHSNKKFPEGENYFNILVISLEIVSDLDEWYMYLFGNNGVFSGNSFIDKSLYSNVDAVILSSIKGNLNPLLNIKANKWYLENAHNYIFINPEKEHSSKGTFFFDNVIKMFGNQTTDFLVFLNSLDNIRCTNPIEYYYNKSHLFTLYCENIIKNQE